MNDHDRRHRMFFWKSLAIALLVVTFPAACAICVSCLTPSVGFGIRPMIQLSFWILWLVSLAFDRAIHKVCEAKTGYWVTYAKDTVFFILTVVTLTLTAMGFLNSAGSWSQWNATYNDRYISFVQEPYVFNLIKTRLTILFPALVGSTFAIEILLLLYILFAYRSSFEILWQRDITRT